MGIETRERGGREIESGAQVISGQLGKTIQRLRKAYNLSLSELAEQSGVAKSIISQIERNETNPTLATIWRLSQALDVSIERVLSTNEEEAFIEKIARSDTPILVSEDGKLRLAIIGWIKTVEWLQWYEVSAEPGGELRFGRPSARLDRIALGQRRRIRSRGRRHHPARQGRRDPALSLRPPACRPLRQRPAGHGSDGLHPQSGGDGLKAASPLSQPACGKPQSRLYFASDETRQDRC